jgi:hypothetical protein
VESERLENQRAGDKRQSEISNQDVAVSASENGSTELATEHTDFVKQEEANNIKESGLPEGALPEQDEGVENGNGEQFDQEESAAVEKGEEVIFSKRSFIQKLSLPQIPILPIQSTDFAPLTKIKPLETPSKWDIGFNYSIGRQIRKTAVTTAKLGDPEFSGDSPARQIFTAYGVRLNRAIGDHFSVGFGFETSIWRYRTRNYEKKITYSTPYEFDSPVGRLPVTNGEFNSLYTSGATSDTILVNLRMVQRLRYVGIPLSFQYEFGNKAFKPYLRFGVIGNFLLRQRTTLFAEKSGFEREVVYKDIEGFKRFQLTLQPAIGVNWQLNDKISLFGEGLINLPATKFYTAPSAAYQKISSQGRGMNVGIRFKL